MVKIAGTQNSLRSKALPKGKRHHRGRLQSGFAVPKSNIG